MAPSSNNRQMMILVAEDDSDDRMLLKEVFEENGFNHRIEFVENGVELLDYLHQRGKYESVVRAPKPDLILLDLNMPVKDGRDALTEIKKDTALCVIPVVVLTTSCHADDIRNAYTAGASSYITKPGSYSDFEYKIKQFGLYWFQVASLPKDRIPGKTTPVLNKPEV